MYFSEQCLKKIQLIRACFRTFHKQLFILFELRCQKFVSGESRAHQWGGGVLIFSKSWGNFSLMHLKISYGMGKNFNHFSKFRTIFLCFQVQTFCENSKYHFPQIFSLFPPPPRHKWNSYTFWVEVMVLSLHNKLVFNDVKSRMQKLIFQAKNFQLSGVKNSPEFLFLNQECYILTKHTCLKYYWDPLLHRWSNLMNSMTLVVFLLEMFHSLNHFAIGMHLEYLFPSALVDLWFSFPVQITCQWLQLIFKMLNIYVWTHWKWHWSRRIGNSITWPIECLDLPQVAIQLQLDVLSLYQSSSSQPTRNCWKLHNVLDSEVFYFSEKKLSDKRSMKNWNSSVWP